MLEIRDLCVNYGAIAALHGISLTVPGGKIVTLIGANGAGKSTTLRAISGIIKVAPAASNSTEKRSPISPPHKIVARGVAQSPEGRMVFSNLTVMENLRMGAYLRKDSKNFSKDSTTSLPSFPA